VSGGGISTWGLDIFDVCYTTGEGLQEVKGDRHFDKLLPFEVASEAKVPHE
jgi:hypothetical protein